MKKIASQPDTNRLGPLCAGGAAEFFEQHGESNFLDLVYAAAPERIRAALAAEVEYLRRAVGGAGRVLELGCGNGRLLEALRGCVRQWVGLDLLPSYLRHARASDRLAANTALAAGVASRLPFIDGAFEVVVCAQNTLGLLGEGKVAALRESVRVTRRGGRLIFVVYSEAAGEPRIEWYTELCRRGMLAPLDWSRSTAELLVTEDGHASECFRWETLEELFRDAGLSPGIEPLGGLYWAVRATV